MSDTRPFKRDRNRDDETGKCGPDRTIHGPDSDIKTEQRGEWGQGKRTRTTSPKINHTNRSSNVSSSSNDSRNNNMPHPFRMATDRETDLHKIQQRQKQIRFGKNTIGYDNYIKAVPKKDRQRHNNAHPKTPDVYLKVSKRQFDGLVQSWRRKLHAWDTKVSCFDFFQCRQFSMHAPFFPSICLH